jgi:hypothetical protein
VSPQDIKTRVKECLVPGSTVDAIEVKYMGTSQFFAGKRVPTTEFTTTLVETQDHFAFSTINAWLTLIQQIDPTADNSGVSLLSSKKNGYASDIHLNLMTYDGVVSRTINWVNCWPKSIGTGSLGYDSAAAVEYAVNWQTDGWHVIK